MVHFMVMVPLSGEQTECCGGSLRRILYRELLGGKWRMKCTALIVLFYKKLAYVIEINKYNAIKGFCSQGRNCK